jgi:hypothetical protein
MYFFLREMLGLPLSSAIVRRGLTLLPIPLKIESPLSWACSSAGRAPALQAGGRRFDPGHVHHISLLLLSS